ncbi:MAG: site-specific integrase [Desulfovibrionaceae bacterium]|nr:site-specific integrase [Desulfovibrionaceae bacterium]
MKLTKRVIESLETTGKRYEVRDSDPVGFVVRVNADGGKAFYYRYRAGKGRAAASRRLFIGSFPTLSVEQAREIAKRKAVVVALGGDPATDVREAKTAPNMADALETFFEQHVKAKLKASTARNYRYLLESYIKPKLGGMKVEAVMHRHIADLHFGMKEAPYAANRAVAALSKFFAWCEANGYRDKGTNPAHGIEQYKEEKRCKFMDSAELEALGTGLLMLEAKNTINPFVAAAIKVMLFTGARCGEVLTLKWTYINTAMGIANLPDSKTGAKALHLPPQALAVLESLPRLNEYCFPGRYGKGHIVNVKGTWRRLLEASGLQGWRIHDLRHAFASAAASSGKSLPIIGKILGHTQASTTSRYTHLSENPVATAVEETAAKLQKALTGGKVLPFRKASGEA